MAPGQDPRASGPQLDDSLADAAADAKPAVARQAGGVSTGVALAGVGALGLAAFLWMSSARTQGQAAMLTTPIPGVQTAEAPEPLPLPATAPAPTGPMYAIPAPQFAVSNAVPAPTMGIPNPALQPIRTAADPDQRRRAPALVVDLSPAGEGAAPTVASPAAPPPGSPAAAAADAAAAQAARAELGAEEKFADRLGTGAADRARATQMRNLDLTISQGAVIPAVLETAINSDLPGFTRAVVSRDVHELRRHERADPARLAA